MVIHVKRIPMGRAPAKKLIPIIGPEHINVGYGVGRLRPVGSRDIRVETRQIALTVMARNHMSGHQV